MSDLIDLRDRMRDFSRDRDWEQFHDPKSLILALVGELGELAELFQWLPADEAVAMSRLDPLRTRVGEELADILIYYVRLADVLGIDVAEEARNKLAAATTRFPVAGVKGLAPDKT